MGRASNGYSTCCCIPGFKLANVAHRVDALGKGAMGLIDYVNSQFDRTVTWDDAAWLAEQWGGPFVIKGLQSPEDAKAGDRHRGKQR